MDIRNILGKLDQLSEGTMASAKKKPTGPKFVGKMKGTDPASAATAYAAHPCMPAAPQRTVSPCLSVAHDAMLT